MPLKIHNGTSLASRCPHVLSYAPTYRAPYRRHLLPSTGDKTNCSINNIIQSGQTTRLTLCSSHWLWKFHIKPRIPIWPKTDIQKIILRARGWEQLLSTGIKMSWFHTFVSLFTCWFRPLLIPPYINESTETRARLHAKVIDNVSSVLCHIQQDTAGVWLFVFDSFIHVAWVCWQPLHTASNFSLLIVHLSFRKRRSLLAHFSSSCLLKWLVLQPSIMETSMWDKSIMCLCNQGNMWWKWDTHT